MFFGMINSCILKPERLYLLKITDDGKKNQRSIIVNDLIFFSKG